MKTSLAFTLTALLLSSGLACADKYPASSVYAEQATIIDKMNEVFPSVHVDVRWMPCLVENSYYQPGSQTIVLCTEFEAYPKTAVYVAAHEMAHAIEMQLTDVTSEQDADELAALLMAKFGYQEELLVSAVYWLEQDDQGRTGEEHPAAGFRAWELACIADGSEPGATAECKALYDGMVVRWEHRLSPEFTTL